MTNKTPKYSPSEALRLAKRLGWTVQPKRRSGDWIYVTPSGDRYTSRTPGRADRVPLRLAKALHEDQRKETTPDVR